MTALADRMNGLRWRLQAMRRLWSAGAEPDMTFLEPEPLDAVPRGRLEVPRAGSEVEGELIEVVGWALFPAAPVSRVEISLNEEPLGRARTGIERPDLIELTDNPNARLAGFNLTADLSALPDVGGEVVLKATAVSTAGERVDIDPVPLTPRREKPGGEATGTSLDLPPDVTPTPGDRSARQILVYTHQLNLGGAQLYLMDLLRGLLDLGTVQPTVISARDGALRGQLESLGVPVHVAGDPCMQNAGAYVGRLEEMALWSSGRNFELVLVNTATTLALPGAELAARLDLPVVWAIHESFPLPILWGPTDGRVREMAEATLARASLVLFEAEATLELFRDKIGEGRGRVVPYGLDLAPIDSERKTFDRAAARRDAGIPEDAQLAVCVGTVEPRKAQLPLAQAFDLVAERHPDAHLAIVGVADDAYSKMLAGFVASAAWRDRAHLIPITPDVQPWYGMADLLVCASDVESLPRTVLEAMAWETPVLATDVFGLPELIEDGMTGWLCQPRDTSSLAEGLDRALSSNEEERMAIGQVARELVQDRHSQERYAAEVGQMIEQLLSKSPA